MASEESVVDDGIVEPGIEPGASAETMLVTTDDSFEEYEQEMNNSLDDRPLTGSTILKTDESISQTHDSTVNLDPTDTSLEANELVSNIHV